MVFLTRSKLGVGKQAPQIKAKIYSGRSGALGLIRESCPLVLYGRDDGHLPAFLLPLQGGRDVCMLVVLFKGGARANSSATLALAGTP